MAIADLNAASVEWIDTTHVIVRYDWSAPAQLDDWIPSAGSTSIDAQNLILTGADDNMGHVRWAQTAALQSLTVDHYSEAAGARATGLYCNTALSWNDNTFLPNPGLGAWYYGTGPLLYWDVDGSQYNDSCGTVPQGWSTYTLTLTAEELSIHSTYDDVTHSRSGAFVPNISGRICFGAYYETPQRWGNVEIRCIVPPEEQGTVQISETVTFDGLIVGSEIRIYEQAHPQIWYVDFDGTAPADLDGKYIYFQAQGASVVAKREVWFDLDNGSSAPHSATVWAGTTSYDAGDYVTNDTDKLYICTTTGTSAGSGGPTGTGTDITDNTCVWDYVATYTWVDVTTGWTATQIATALSSAISGMTDLDTTSSDGSIVTVRNGRNGNMAAPIDGGTLAQCIVWQVGGTSIAEVDGIESCTESTWIATYDVLWPRLVTFAILRNGYEPVRVEGYRIGRYGHEVPPLQRVDLNYLNP